MISQRIKELRTEKKLTQNDLASILGIAKTTLAAYEQGKNQPSIETILHLSEYFNVSVDYLMGKTNHRTKFDVETRTKQLELLDRFLSTSDNSVLANLAEISEYLLSSKSGNLISNDVSVFLDNVTFALTVIINRYFEYYAVAYENSKRLNEVPSEKLMQLANKFDIQNYHEALYFAQQGFYPRAQQENLFISKCSQELIEKLYNTINSLNTLSATFKDKYKDGNYTYEGKSIQSSQKAPTD